MSAKRAKIMTLDGVPSETQVLSTELTKMVFNEHLGRFEYLKLYNRRLKANAGMCDCKT